MEKNYLSYLNLFLIIILFLLVLNKNEIELKNSNVNKDLISNKLNTVNNISLLDLKNQQDLFEEIVNSKDSVKCNELFDKELKKICINNINFNIVSSIAVESKNINICNNLIKTDLIFQCQYIYNNSKEVLN